MLETVISEELKKVCPRITLGCLQAQVKVESSSNNLWQKIIAYCDILKNEIPIDELASLPMIRDGREVYKKLGKVPSKYRLSSEALIRRVLQGKGVYRINNIVDINNLVSLKSKFPVGSYNLQNLSAPISLGIGQEGERYKGIGKELINIENLPVLSDSNGSFGSPTSDSERAMVINEASEIIMYLYSFSGGTYLEEYVGLAKELLEQYASGKNIKTKII